jgi:hypothetical protein
MTRVSHCACSIVLLVAVVVALFGCRAAPGAAQPIAFSHEVHAGEFRIDCLYCHSGARRSTVAGIPSVQLCMGCHKLVAANRP